MITLKQYIERLQQLEASVKDSDSLILIYSEDDEGNAFREVICGPELGRFEDDEFIGNEESDSINAICLN